MLGQQGGQAPGQGQGQGDMTLRPSSQFAPVLKNEAAYLLKMYDKAYSAMLTAEQEVTQKQQKIDEANARLSEINAEKQMLVSQKAQYQNAAEKWAAMYSGLNVEYQTVLKNRSDLSKQVNKLNADLYASQGQVSTLSKQLQQVKQTNAELEIEVERLKSGTPALVRAALKEKKKPTLYERIRSVPSSIAPLGSPATQAGAGVAWLLAGLFIIGRIE